MSDETENADKTAVKNQALKVLLLVLKIATALLGGYIGSQTNLNHAVTSEVSK